MYSVTKLFIEGVYHVTDPFHPFGGAVDIIVVQQPDGSFKSSPWYVRFGKFQGVLKTKEKVVNINVNGVESNFNMYLDNKGEAYFLSDSVGELQEEDLSVFSPPSSGEETDEQSQNESSIESKSLNIDANNTNSSDQNDKGDGKIVNRTNSRRSGILGLVFGRKYVKKDNGIEEGNVERVDSIERAEIAAELMEMKWSTNLPTDEVTNRNFNSSKPKEHDLEVSEMEETDVAVTQRAISATSGVLENAGDVTKMGSLSGSLVLDLENSNLAEIEVKPSSNSVIEQAPKENNGILGDGVYEEEISKARVSSYIYCEASESSSAGDGNSGNEVIETPNLTHVGLEEVQVHAGVHYETKEHFSDVNSRPESSEITLSGNVGLLSDENSGKISETDAMDFIAKGNKIESHSLVDRHIVTSDFVEAENLQVVQLKTITKRISDEKKLESESVEVFENQIMRSNYPCTSSNNDLHMEKPSLALGFEVPMASDGQILGSLGDKLSPRCCASSNFRSSIHQDQEEESFGEENKIDKFHSPSESIVYPQGSNVDNLPTEITNLSGPLSESSEEDQFLIGDIDHSFSNTIECKEPISPDFTAFEDHPLASLDDIQNEHDSNEINHDSPSSSDKLIQEFPPVTSPLLLDESRTKSSPLSIPCGRKGRLEEVERRMESLPNFPSHIDNLETSDVLHPLSCSLDSASKSLWWEMFKKDGSVPFKSHPDSDGAFLKEQHRAPDTYTPEDLKRMSSIPGIEISLCKHLLYEGMGVDAASQAFDAEKVDLEKLVSLASAPLKNDRPIVRIGGHYFPWDAAFPIISGMPSFGHDQSLQADGMIAVDQVDKTLEGQSPRSIFASGGSWKWPFSFTRSRTLGSLHPGLRGTKDSDTENASESSSYLLGDKTEHKLKVSEKKVKSVVPISEQLASLNLKEGQNMVTFTSIGMLGKQQVDARIYLWKWNTRIVVSDVDGTITKSDVLGQFMPLVGKDWSQTGVAHLFSAIEDNGYQFLFLSARAVSQACLTRRFINNLKQDGKALPDGPVVISPDGLFPSLFREVIRRAPHEFKIACLEEIKALFPPDCQPFYAGFGNRYTDEISYLKVGIPKGKIFTINPKGEVAVHRRVDMKSYTSLHALVNGMFPAMSSAGKEEFNEWNYWKIPLPHLDI